MTEDLPPKPAFPTPRTAAEREADGRDEAGGNAPYRARAAEPLPLGDSSLVPKPVTRADEPVVDSGPAPRVWTKEEVRLLALTAKEDAALRNPLGMRRWVLVPTGGVIYISRAYVGRTALFVLGFVWAAAFVFEAYRFLKSARRWVD